MQEEETNIQLKWMTYLIRHFTKQHIKISKQHMKIYLISSVIKEMKNKTIVRYYLTLTKTTFIKKRKVYARMWRKWNLHTLASGNVK